MTTLDRQSGTQASGATPSAKVPVSAHAGATDVQRVSIIIPARNEAASLAHTLATVLTEPVHEVLVVDGCSTDETVAVARRFDAEGVRIVTASPSRGGQMNAGAAHATGDVLLFLHADTLPPRDFVSMICAALDVPDFICGAFDLHINGQRRSYRLIERMVRWRSRTRHMPYGDQALFMQRTAFEQIGGFPDIPLMEDVVLMRRLRRLGRVVICAAAVSTSDRRWRRRGIWRTTLLNQTCYLAYMCGISPFRIARWRDRANATAGSTPEMVTPRQA